MLAGCVMLVETGALSSLLSSFVSLLLPTRRLGGSDGLRAGCAGLCRVREETDVADSVQ